MKWTKQSYRKYLKTPVWRARRLEILDRDGHRCTSCNSVDKLQVHHIKYDVWRMPHEVDDFNLITLCKPCHAKEHEGKKISEFYNYPSEAISKEIQKAKNKAKKKANKKANNTPIDRKSANLPPKRTRERIKSLKEVSFKDRILQMRYDELKMHHPASKPIKKISLSKVELSDITNNTELWRIKTIEILKRDNYKCTRCGSKAQVSIEVKKPSRKIDNKNLRTTCIKCKNNR